VGGRVQADPEDRFPDPDLCVHHVHGAGVGSGEYPAGVDRQILDGFEDEY
jgi:hypothetical protein